MDALSWCCLCEPDCKHWGKGKLLNEDGVYHEIMDIGMRVSIKEKLRRQQREKRRLRYPKNYVIYLDHVDFFFYIVRHCLKYFSLYTIYWGQFFFKGVGVKGLKKRSYKTRSCVYTNKGNRKIPRSDHHRGKAPKHLCLFCNVSRQSILVFAPDNKRYPSEQQGNNSLQ